MGEREFEARWIGHADPVPDGWELAAREGQIQDHHNHYARMIVRVVTQEPEGEGR